MNDRKLSHDEDLCFYDPYRDYDLDIDIYGECCVACGEPIGYCMGHGEIGDPIGLQILEQHAEGDHSSCNPRGCEEANNE
jgi:hypothetical protein